MGIIKKVSMGMSAEHHLPDVGIWSELTQTTLLVSKDEYQLLCSKASAEELQLECAQLIVFAGGSTPNDADVAHVYRGRYAQAFGALIALLAEALHNSRT